ncbi:MAG TPA: YraN family protein [Lentisphaeria bacterium]|nr:YraN family protein [Lentisphaeria bacterium]
MRRPGYDNTQGGGSGRAAEDLAADYLQAQGLQLLERNFRVRGGELDLICREGKVLVFVEVRLRRRADYGGAAGSIGAGKRARLILAARHYLMRLPECDCRFDCVLLDRLDSESIDWIKDAFSADD